MFEYKMNQVEEQRMKLHGLMVGEIISMKKGDMKDLAKKANVCYSTIYNWKTGKTLTPRVETLTKVALTLGYKIKLTIK